MTPTRQIPTWLFAATLIASLATVVGPLILFGATEQGWRLAARYTVRVSFLLFLMAYLAGPLMVLWRSSTSRWLIRNRRYLGLNFAIAHTAHLGALASYFFYLGIAPDAATLIGGGLAYALIFMMAATSNDWSVTNLGPYWHRLHSVGLHYVWFIFLITYLGRFSGGEAGDTSENMIVIAIVGSSLVLVALMIRLTAFWTSRRRRSPA